MVHNVFTYLKIMYARTEEYCNLNWKLIVQHSELDRPPRPNCYKLIQTSCKNDEINLKFVNKTFICICAGINVTNLIFMKRPCIYNIINNYKCLKSVQEYLIVSY